MLKMKLMNAMNKKKLYAAMMLVLFATCLGGCSLDDADGSGSPVKIHEVVPEYAYPGDEVILYGSNLPLQTVLKVNEQPAEIVEQDESRIKFIVPDTETGLVTLESSEGTVSYAGFKIYEDVVIRSFYPAKVTYEGELVIKGSGFDIYDTASNIVTIVQEDGETDPLKVLKSAKDSIVVLVENFFVGPNKIRVKVGKNQAVSEDLISFVSDARIDKISPARGGAGTVVTIKGMNFITEDIGQNSVFIGETQLEVVRVLDRTEMEVRIPKDLDLFDQIRVSVPGEEQPAVSTEKFRYDPAADIAWGKKGLAYGSMNVPVQITQNIVDSLQTMGVNFMTFRCNYAADQGLTTGKLPDNANVVLDNVIKVKQMSEGRIKTILVIGYNKVFEKTKGYPVSETSIRTYFENIKQYQYNGFSAWDCVDAFQVLYSSAELNDFKTEDGIRDYVDKVLKPVYRYIHPEGYCKVGEKFVFGPQAILNNANFMVRADVIQATELLENLDVYLMMWNLPNGSGDVYYSRPVPENVFYNHWNNLAKAAICSNPDYPVSFMTPEVNINAINAKYQKADELGVAIQSIVNEMNKEPNFKGFGYRAFLEDNVGIRRSDNRLDPRTDDNKVEPQISFYDLYRNLTVD